LLRGAEQRQRQAWQGFAGLSKGYAPRRWAAQSKGMALLSRALPSKGTVCAAGHSKGNAGLGKAALGGAKQSKGDALRS